MKQLLTAAILAASLTGCAELGQTLEGFTPEGRARQFQREQNELDRNAGIQHPIEQPYGYGVTASLVDGKQGQSVTGQFVWICTYEYAGQQHEVVMKSYCPATIQLQ